jgi:hypothetical protein
VRTETDGGSSQCLSAVGVSRSGGGVVFHLPVPKAAPSGWENAFYNEREIEFLLSYSFFSISIVL